MPVTAYAVTVGPELCPLVDCNSPTPLHRQTHVFLWLYSRRGAD